MRLKLKYGDFLVVLAIILVAVFFVVSFYQNNTDKKVAIISQNNIILDQIELNQVSKSYVINYSGKYPGIIEVDAGKIRFLHADCPDQVCVNTGWIDRPGQIAVCLPAGVIIKIDGVQTDVDIIVH